MFKRTILQHLGAILFFSITSVYGQSTVNAPNKEYYTPPDILPKTPQTEGMFKYTPYAVDYPSGSVNTTIPLFTVKSGRITLPISISYNAGGVKVQELSSMIGLGWNLNFGYSISVSEEETKPYSYDAKQYKSEAAALSATNLTVDWMNEMKRSADGYYNTMRTFYNYRCGDVSGGFFYDDQQRLRKAGKQVNVKIERLTGSNGYLLGFTIITGDGLKYIFDQRETTKRISQDNPSVNAQTTAFWCSSITDLLTGENVNFTYRQKPAYDEYSNESYQIRYVNAFYYNDETLCTYNPIEERYSMGRYQVNGLQIEKITFNGGYINFISDDLRLDIDKTKITGLNIYSSVQANVLKKQIVFHQGYFQSTGGSNSIYNYRLKLDSVDVKPVQQQVASVRERFSFLYNGITLPPYRVNNTAREANTTGVDYWGYYNGNTGGSSLIPTQIKEDILAQYPNTFVQQNFTSTDRKANANYTQAAVMTRINYPTGGYATFDYENHSAANYYLGSILGGLRIKKIKYFSDKNSLIPSIQKSYNYLSAQPLAPVNDRQIFSYSKVQRPVGVNISNYMAICGNRSLVHNIFSGPLFGLASYKGSPVFYEKVEEIDGLDNQYTNGKTVYYTKFQPPPYALSSMKEFCFRKLMPYNLPDATTDSVETYKFNPSGTNGYSLISKDIFDYSSQSPDSIQISSGDYRIQVGLAVSKNDDIASPQYTWDLVGFNADSWYLNEATYQRIPKHAFLYNDLYITPGYPVLSGKRNYKYVDGATMQTQTNYFYDSPFHKQLTRIETTDSKGDLQKTVYKYIQDVSDINDIDYLESPNGAFAALAVANKLDDIVEEKYFVNNTLIKRNRSKFRTKYPNAQDYVMPYIRSKHTYNYLGTITGEQQLTLSEYDDHLNLLEQRYDNSVSTSYLRNETSTEIMAQVSGSSYIDAYYTSFEIGSRGKWIFTGSPQYDMSAKTGGYVYNLQSGSTISTPSTLSASKTYVVSYWSRNGAFNIPGSIVVNNGIINGWTNYQHKVTGQSAITISGSGVIDELRLCPLDAQMTTYTYDALVGMTSMTDANNLTTYYEYDVFQRLMNIKDQNGKITKHIDYHYGNQ